MESTGPEWTELTLWSEDTPASPSPTLAFDAAKMIPDTFGPCSPIAFAWYDPDTHSWKTSQATLVSGSDQFSQTWPRSGMTLNGTAYQLPPSAPRTSATAYSLSLHGEALWPTPTTRDRGKDAPNRKGGKSLGMAVRLWPTPVTSDWKNSGFPPAAMNRDNLPAALMKRNGAKAGDGHLNPNWVEWLMGFPVGWTDLEDSATP